MTGATGEDPYLNRTRQIIAAHGHAVQIVVPRAGEPGVPYAYTVGLTAAGHPELITAALDAETMQYILNVLGTRIRGGARLGHGSFHGEVIVGYDVAVVGPVDDVSDQEYPVGVAVRRLYPQAGLPMQVVWPDRAGLYPWQPGYDMDSFRQPLLASPPAGWEPA